MQSVEFVMRAEPGRWDEEGDVGIGGGRTIPLSSAAGERLSILWVTPKWPLPAEDGARLATCNLIRGAARRHEVDLLAFAGPDEVVRPAEARARLGVRSAVAIRRDDPIGLMGTADEGGRWARLARAALSRPLLPLSMSAYGERRLMAQAAAYALARGPWTLTLFDGLQGAAAFSRAGGFHPRRGLGRIVYRAHNVETDLWLQSRDRADSTVRRLVLAQQASRVLAFERSLVWRAGRTLAVSTTDVERFRAHFPELPDERWACVPIGMDFSACDRVPLPPARGLRLLFVGRLDDGPNRDGLQWLLREVWPSVAQAREDVVLEIAGSGAAEWLRPLVSRLPGGDRIAVRGRVASVDALYFGSSLALVPVRYGAAARVKVIEAARFRRPVLGTSLGVQGLGLVAGHTFFHAESKQEWIEMLRRLSPERCAEVGIAACADLRTGFDSAVVTARFQAVLRALGAAPFVLMTANPW